MDSLRLTTALSLPADTAPADTAQAFALRLKRSLAGYGSKLAPDADIVVMGLDSTNGMKGRLAVMYYRELKGSEFLERIEAWHTKMAWHQNFGKDSHFIGAPAPKDTMAKFEADDYVNDAPLTGEFLLGYHCQRHDLRPPKADADDATPDNNKEP